MPVTSRVTVAAAESNDSTSNSISPERMTILRGPATSGLATGGESESLLPA